MSAHRGSESVAVSMDDCAFSYGDRPALEGVSLAVAPGEIVGLLGPNGAGKSTAIKLVIGLLAPRSGRVEVLGLPMPERARDVHARLGVVFEEKNLYPALSARENLAFFARLHGRGDVDLDALLDRVGLASRGRDRVQTFSKGMRQRLTVARALVNAPDVLVLDEPTDGLDPVSSRSVRDLVRAEAARGAAVLITTHDMAEADELADRVAFINGGRILAVDTPEALKLAHGQRAVHVRWREADGGVGEASVPIDGDGAAELAALVAGRDVLTIHTEEASLEDVFVAFAGRGLA